jgi:hypothetical protein
MTTTTRVSLCTPIYRHYQHLWRLACERRSQWIEAVAPETGGVELYAHNWHRCAIGTSLEKPHSKATVEACYVLDRGAREYDLAQHREHVRDNEVGRYLWCDACQDRPWAGRGWDHSCGHH